MFLHMQREAMPIRSSRFVAWLIRWNGPKSRGKDSVVSDVQMLTTRARERINDGNNKDSHFN